jgi:hypothetical protein
VNERTKELSSQCLFTRVVEKEIEIASGSDRNGVLSAQ